jgi:hypothetical protein
MIRGIGPVYAKKMVKAFGDGSVLIWAGLELLDPIPGTRPAIP